MLGRILAALVLAVMVGGAAASPSFGKGNDGHRGGREKGWHENRGRGHGWDRRPVYRPYRRRERIYVPPPVIYEAPEPPGVDIFLPRIIIRP